MHDSASKPVIGTSKSKSTLKAQAEYLPGVALCLLIAVLASFLGDQFPIIGGPVFSIVLGIVIGNLVCLPAVTKPGITFSSKKVLQTAIVALGGSLSLGQVWQTGVESLSVMLTTLAVSLVGAWLLGKSLGVSGRLTTLVGVGTGICGGSAIAAVAPIIKADDDEIAFSLSTVFMFNVIAVVVFPLLGHMMGLDQHSFGLWAGTAVNDTSSVVAAGYSYGQLAGQYATIVKLARTTMIIPITLALALLEGKRSGKTNYDLVRVFPWFIVLFALASLLNTVGWLGVVLPSLLGKAGKFLIVVALAGVGLGGSVRKMISIGPKPIFLGLVVWVLVAVTSLVMQMLTGQL